MIKIGITGSLASGKSTAGKILSSKKGPLFSADVIVSRLYKNNNFKKYISKKFDIKNQINMKKAIKKKILENKSNFKKLEKIIHPLVRKEMINFLKKNKNKKFTFFEIPLLIESRLMKKFDVIFFIKANKNLRLRRFKAKGGDKKFFNILNSKQLSDSKKARHSDHIIVNEKNLNILKRNLLYIFQRYE